MYTLLFFLGLPLVWLRLLWRARRNPLYAKRWRERLGYSPFPFKMGAVWWHAVSVGEVLTAVPLIKRFQQIHPDVPIMVTTMTPTGSAQVRARLGDSVQHVYAPYDLPHAIARFLHRLKPRLLVIMETELWPNLLAACRANHVPIILANARLSEKSAKGYGRFSRLTREMLANITIIAVQNPTDGERFVKLGFPRARLHITGTVKFDIAIPDTLRGQAKQLRETWGQHRPVWIAASTHFGEEKIILSAMQKIREQHPNVLLLLVPRHPDRVKQVLALCDTARLSVCKRSDNQLPTPQQSVFLIDTLGELLLFYAAADVAFVGGSLINKGGHNILEPAALGLPILTGPSLFNFAEVALLFTEANALIYVNTVEDIALKTTKLLNNNSQRLTLGKAAQTIIEANRGAKEKQLALISQMLQG